MLFQKSTAHHTLQRIVKSITQLESIDTWVWPIILPRRYSGSDLSHLNQPRVEVNIEQTVQDQGFITAKEKMPPEKLKLAAKLKNITSARKINAADIDLPQHSDVPEAVSETIARMQNEIQKSKLNMRKLRPKVSDKKSEEGKPEQSLSKHAPKAVVDLEMMKEELKQLEDPPIAPEEILLSANRLGFDFFDVPCETLAKNLLGKILVRRLENGTLLKGKIVETESYLGGEDKASQTYRNKVTPRNIPMYMPPGTIYVYLTYGMYHCFNVSSREQWSMRMLFNADNCLAPGASVFVRALEPILGHSYMELLRNTQLKRGSKEKEMRKKIKSLKPHQLCNGPSKFCTAFEIDKETFNEKDITKCPLLWIENDDGRACATIVSAPRIGIDSAGPQWAAKPLRFYLFENDSVRTGSVVLIRALAPIQGMKEMGDFRNMKPTVNSKARSLRNFKDHELSNGPSKFCMAFNLSRDHSKYSICSWRGMWIEDDPGKGNIKIIECPRIGIDSAGPEWASKPLRFYILGELSVSKRDKKAEAHIDT